MLDQIKSQLDLVDLVGQYTTLRRSGSRMKGLCPFHSEKSPSFTVDGDHYHCYGCGKHGDHFALIQEMEGVSFPEAKRILARKAGIAIEDKEYERQDKVFYINESVQRTWAAGDTGYWESRGYTEETINKFGLGWCDKVLWTNKTWYLLHDAGVFIDGKQLLYDRASVPLKNLTGRIVGFAGRSLTGHPKYINTPETSAYKKSGFLYGLYEGKDFIRRLRSCYVVEGYTDVISLHQRGIKNIVASCGTAFTDDHCSLIKRYCNKIVFMFDGDKAGADATIRGIKTAIKWEMEVFVVPLDCDPDEHTGEFIEIDAIEYLSRRIKGSPNEISAMIRDVCSAITDRITAKIYIDKFAKEYGVDRADIESIIQYKPTNLEDKLIDLYFARPELKEIIRESVEKSCIIDQDDVILQNEPVGGNYIYVFSPDYKEEATIILAKLSLDALQRQQSEVMASDDLDFKQKALNLLKEKRIEVSKQIPIQWQQNT